MGGEGADVASGCDSLCWEWDVASELLFGEEWGVRAFSWAATASVVNEEGAEEGKLDAVGTELWWWACPEVAGLTCAEGEGGANKLPSTNTPEKPLKGFVDAVDIMTVLAKVVSLSLTQWGTKPPAPVGARKVWA